ncbi:MAG: hypothetical protein H7122_04325 [Chitinophagaceae bacterium]|nr:hypothetical protein [Chitinophagaceae bacterium]
MQYKAAEGKPIVIASVGNHEKSACDDRYQSYCQQYINNQNSHRRSICSKIPISYLNGHRAATHSF